ncbi:apolipoprotein N-acyltransferase [Leucobacter zeae]|nr:apolipoprotein N-acyltransferase [Leucobacter zeae]
MTGRAGAPRRLPVVLALPAAVAGGLLLDVASPGVAWWPAAFLGCALVCAAIWNQGVRAGLGAGFLAGAAFWMPHISWLTLYLGPVPWLGLCAVMILWFALFGVLAAITTRGLALGRERIPRLGGARGSVALIATQALAVAGLWVARESVQGSWPYGGFAWGRLAHTQADGPLAQSVSWFGFSGLSGAIALACALPVAAWFAGAAGGADRVLRSRRAIAIAAAAGVALLLGLAAVPAAPLERTGTLRVAAVQGNSKSGIFDDRDSGSVLGDHLAATERLLDELERADDRVDLIVWPENSGEFDFTNNPLAELRVARLAERADAPILVGTVLPNDDGSYSNSAVVWGPDGASGGRYDKRFPVPFAEYMPNRDFFHALAPDLVDLVQLEYTPGVRPAAVDVPGDSGPVRAGVAICFDITFDAQAVAMVDAGAEVILAPTNNADFGRTDESAQQLAIARLRAIETGRAVVNISTVGTSATIDPEGSDLAAIAPFTAGAMTADVPLSAGETPAIRFGSGIAGAWIVVGLAGTASAVAIRAVARRRGRDAGEV